MSDVLDRFLAAQEKESAKINVPTDDVEKAAPNKSKLSFAKFEINRAASTNRLQEIASTTNDSLITSITDTLDNVADLNGKSNQEQKKGLVKLDAMKKQLEYVKNNDARELLEEQISLLKDGLERQSTLTSTIAEKFDKQADNIGGVFGAVLGNSPLAGMITKYVIGSIRDKFKQRAELKQARLDAEKDAAKSLAAQNDIVKAVEEENSNDSISKVEIVGQAKDLSVEMSDRVERKKGSFRRADGKKKFVDTSPKIVKPDLKAEEARREGLTQTSPKVVTKVKTKKGSALGSLVKLLTFVFPSVVGGVLVKALSPITKIVSSMVHFVPKAISGLMKLIGIGGNSVIPTGTKPKQNKKGSLLKRMVNGGKTLAKGALRFAGPAAAVAGVGATSYAVGSYINDKFLTNKDGSGKIANALYDFFHPQTNKERDNINKEKYLRHVNNLIKAGATKSEAKRAMSEGRYEEKLKELRLKKATVNNNAEISMKRVGAIADTNKELRVIEQNKVTSGSQEPAIVNAPTTVVNNSSNTTIQRMRPMLANQDVSFTHANLSGAF